MPSRPRSFRVTAITVVGAPACEGGCRGNKGNVMAHTRKISLVSRILLLAALSLATPATAAFDGEWNVQIASSKGTCSSGTSVSIGINNGQVASSDGMVAASGRVA